MWNTDAWNLEFSISQNVGFYKTSKAQLMCFTGFILFVKSMNDKNHGISNIKGNFTIFERNEESLRLMEEGGERDEI